MKHKKNEFFLLLFLIIFIIGIIINKTNAYIENLKNQNQTFQKKYSELMNIKTNEKVINQTNESFKADEALLKKKILRAANINEFKFVIIEKYKNLFSKFEKYNIVFKYNEKKTERIKTAQIEITCVAASQSVTEIFNFLNNRNDYFQLTSLQIKKTAENNYLDIILILSEYYYDELSEK